MNKGTRFNPNIWKLSLIVTMSLAFGVTIVMNWPGHYSFDSIVQLAEGETGQFWSMHPPAMSIVLGLLTRAAGNGAFMLVDTLLFYISLYLLLAKRIPLYPLSVLIALVFCCLNPIVLIYNGIVWKDVMFANVSMLAFALADRARQKSSGFAIAALIVFAFAALVRQQGLIVAISGAALLAWNARISGERAARTSMNFLLFIGVLAFAILTLQTTTNLFIKTRSGNVDVQGLYVLATFDIAGITATAGSKANEVLRQDGLNAKAFSNAVRKEYSPERVDTLLATSALLASQPVRQTFDLWLAMIRHFPGSWARHRWNSWWELLANSHESGRCLPLYVGVMPNPLDAIQSSSHPPVSLVTPVPKASPFSHSLFDYGNRFLFLFNGLAFLIVGACVAIVGFFWGESLLASLCASGLLFTLSYLIIGVACDFRYQYFGTLSAMIGALTLLARIPIRTTQPDELSKLNG